MSNQLTNNAEALRLFFTEDVYLVKDLLNDNLHKKKSIQIDLNASVEAKLIFSDDAIVEKFTEVSAVAEPEIQPLTKPQFKYLGKNEKKILILVNDEQHETSTIKGRELLRKLVLAIGLTAKDFALVNYANYQQTSLSQLLDFFSSKIVLSFGVSSSALSLSEHPLHTCIAVGTTNMVITSNLKDLDNDEASKKLLWNSLKKLKIDE